MSRQWITQALEEAARASITSAEANEAGENDVVALRDYAAAEQLLSELVSAGQREHVGPLARCIASQAQIHTRNDHLEEASDAYERALNKDGGQPEILRAAVDVYLKRLVDTANRTPDEFHRLATRAAGLAKTYGLDDKALASEAHGEALNSYSKGAYEPAALLAEMAADLDAGDLHYRSNSGSFWSHCAWTGHEPGSDDWQAHRRKAMQAWTRCLDIDPDYIMARLDIVECQLTGREFSSASTSAQSCWILRMDDSERAICAWLGSMAAMLNDEPESHWKELRDHLCSIKGKLALAYWQTTEVERFLPSIEAPSAVRSVHDCFVRLRS